MPAKKRKRGEAAMARFRHYDPEQTKMIPVCYARQLLPGTFEHALSYLIDNEIDLGRFAARFKNDEAVAPAYDRRTASGSLTVVLIVGNPKTGGCFTRIFQIPAPYAPVARPDDRLEV